VEAHTLAVEMIRNVMMILGLSLTIGAFVLAISQA